jgi:hypothetical protein
MYRYCTSSFNAVYFNWCTGNSHFNYQKISPFSTVLKISPEQIGEIFRTVEKNSVLIGDFNLPDWVSGTAGSKPSSLLLEEADAAGLHQLVEFPTQIHGNILDLVLTNMPDRIDNVEQAGRLEKSDHVSNSSGSHQRRQNQGEELEQGRLDEHKKRHQ